MIGDKNDHLKFIKKFAKNVNFNFIRKKYSPTIIKKDILTMSIRINFLGFIQLMTIWLILNKTENSQKFNQLIKKHDLIVVSDYGHGFIDDEFAKQIINSKYISLNAQVNAVNVGYHSSKYSKANVLVINERTDTS